MDNGTFNETVQSKNTVDYQSFFEKDFKTFPEFRKKYERLKKY